MAVYVRRLNALLLALGYDGRPVSVRDFHCKGRFPHVGRVLVWLLDCCCASTLPVTKKQVLLNWETNNSENVEHRVAITCDAASLVAKQAGVVLSKDGVSLDTSIPAAPALQQLVSLSRALLRHGREAIWRQQQLKSAAGSVDRDNACCLWEAAEPAVVTSLDASSAVSTAVGRRATTTSAASVVTGRDLAGGTVAAAPVASEDEAEFASKLGLAAYQRLLSRVQELESARSSALQLMDAGGAIRNTLERHNSSSRKLYWQRTQVFLEQLGLYLDTNTAAGQHAAIKAALVKQLQKDRLELKKAQIECDQIQRDIKSSAASLQKATQENERVEKRLETVHDLKSPFQEEYDKLMPEVITRSVKAKMAHCESFSDKPGAHVLDVHVDLSINGRKWKNELHGTYVTYVTCIRNARFLEQQAEKPRQEEQQLQRAQQRQLQQVQEKLREDAAQLLRAFDPDSSDVEEDIPCSKYASAASNETEKCATRREQERFSNRQRGALTVSAMFQDLEHTPRRQLQQQHFDQPEDQHLLTAYKTGQQAAVQGGDTDLWDCRRPKGDSKNHEQHENSTNKGRQEEDALLRKDREPFLSAFRVGDSSSTRRSSGEDYLSSRSEGRRHSTELCAFNHERTSSFSRCTDGSVNLRRCNSAAVAARHPTVISSRVPTYFSKASRSGGLCGHSFEARSACSSSNRSVRRKSCSGDDSHCAASRSVTEVPTDPVSQPISRDVGFLINAEEDEDEADAFEAGLRKDFLSPQERRQEQQRFRMQALQDVLF